MYKTMVENDKNGMCGGYTLKQNIYFDCKYKTKQKTSLWQRTLKKILKNVLKCVNYEINSTHFEKMF